MEGRNLLELVSIPEAGMEAGMAVDANRGASVTRSPIPC
jgi:hypothetical protein